MDMREIKFRAWNEIEKTMGEPFTLQQAIRVRPAVDPTDDCIYLQYTGLHDKNGKEIFEGDILTDSRRVNSTVIWDEFEYDGFICGHGWNLGKPNIWGVIIGDIYSNPELLTSTKS